MSTVEDAPFEGRWALVEIMGHNQAHGLVAETVFAGAPMIRVAAPLEDGTWREQLLSPSSIYRLTWATEDAVRATLRPWGLRDVLELDVVADEFDDDDDDDDAVYSPEWPPANAVVYRWGVAEA